MIRSLPGKERLTLKPAGNALLGNMPTKAAKRGDRYRDRDGGVMDDEENLIETLCPGPAMNALRTLFPTRSQNWSITKETLL
jgi:hypothetical protein